MQIDESNSVDKSVNLHKESLCNFELFLTTRYKTAVDHYHTDKNRNKSSTIKAFEEMKLHVHDCKSIANREFQFKGESINRRNRGEAEANTGE